MDKIKLFIKESWLLVIAACVFGLSLAMIEAAWKPQIIANKEAKFSKKIMGFEVKKLPVPGLMPGSAKVEKAFDIPIELKGKTTITEVKKVLDANGDQMGWAFSCTGSGYADKIELIVAVDTNFEFMAGFDVLFSNETPGFGDKITIKDGFFQRQFINAPVDVFKLSKIGNPDTVDSQIVAITGATITSQAVVDTFNDQLEIIKQKVLEEQKKLSKDN